MIEVKEIKNQDEFNSFINMDKENLHVIKMGAEWCGPCRQLSNIIHNLDADKIGNTVFGEIDIDNDNTEDIVTEYKIRNIPVMLFIKNGELVHKSVGLINTDMIYNLFETHK
jgi:thioredoxin 1